MLGSRNGIFQIKFSVGKNKSISCWKRMWNFEVEWDLGK
jgi:hypothetical protein